MRLDGGGVVLRAVEPADAELLHTWENDLDLWAVSGTVEPFSREQIEQFIARQLAGYDLLHSGQLRLMIETSGAADKAGAVGTPEEVGTPEKAGKTGKIGNVGTSRMVGMPETVGTSQTAGMPGGVETVGAVDLFDYDPIHRRAGVGILIYGAGHRRRGYARGAIDILCRYARERLNLHQLWCTVGADNRASRELFRQAGFVESGTRRDWRWTPAGFEDEIFLQKILEA